MSTTTPEVTTPEVTTPGVRDRFGERTPAERGPGGGTEAEPEGRTEPEPGHDTGLRSKGSRRWPHAAFLLGLFAAMLWGRWGSIVYPVSLNPDEASSTVNAMRLHAFGYSWTAFDGASNGYFDSLPLAAPYLVGLTPTLASTRIVAWLVLCVIVAEVYAIARRLGGTVPAVLAVLGLASFYGFNHNTDFLHYASEPPPLALALGAFAVMARRSPRPWAYAVFGALMTAAPFGKLQIVPVALPIGILAIRRWWAQGGARLRNLAAVVAGAGLTLGFLFLPVLADHGFGDIYQSYVVWVKGYIVKPLPFDVLFHLPLTDPTLSSFLLVSAVTILLARALALRSGGAAARSGHPDGHRDVAVTAAVCLLAALYAVRKSGYAHPHYLNLVIPFVALVVSALARPLDSTPFGRRVGAVVGAWSLVIVALPVASLAAAPWSPPPLGEHTPRTLRLSPPDHGLFAWLTRPSDHLLVWGFEPSWYLLAGVRSSTREPVNSFPEPMRAYYTSRFIGEFDGAKPEVIVDAETSPPRIGFLPGVATSMPPLAQRLADDYVKVSAPQGCPTTYVRRARFGEVSRRLVTFSAITGTTSDGSPIAAQDLARLDDGSVTEERCDDFLTLPDGAGGTIRFGFAGEAPVEEIMILNTFGGQALDHRTERARVVLYDGTEPVFDKEIELNDRPSWTIVPVAGTRATSLRIDVLGFKGVGAGLNEVKVFRSASPGT